MLRSVTNQLQTKRIIFTQDQIQLIGVQFSGSIQRELLKRMMGGQKRQEFDIFHKKKVFFIFLTVV